MKLTAYIYDGVWREWEGVDAWVINGPTLTMFRTKVNGRRESGSVALPREVVGLADDSPARPTTGAWASTPPKPATSGPRPAQIPPRERPSQKDRRRW